MDEASEDSRPAQSGFVKKFFLTISQVIFQFLLVSADGYWFLVLPDFLTLIRLQKHYHPAWKQGYCQ